MPERALDLLGEIAQRQPWRLAALATALLLTTLHLGYLRAEPALPSYNWTFALWIGAIGLYLLAIAPLRRPRVDWRSAWREPRRRAVTLAVAGIVLAGFALRFWRVGGIPPTLGGDEGSQGGKRRPDPLVPDVNYNFLRFGMDARLRAGKFTIGSHFAPRFLTSLKNVDQEYWWFPGATGSGIARVSED